MVTVGGSAADGSYLSVEGGSFELEERAVFHGEITAIRGGFAVVVADGSLPPGSMISVNPGAPAPEPGDGLPLEDA